MSNCKWTWKISYEVTGKKELHTFLVTAFTIQGALAEAVTKIGKYVGTSECKILEIQRCNPSDLEEVDEGE